MTADIDAVLSRLRERPECRDAVEVIERLRGWKADALVVMADEDRVWQAAGRPGPLGASKSECVIAEIERLTAERDRLREALDKDRLQAFLLAEERAVWLYGGCQGSEDSSMHATSAAMLAEALSALGESPVPDEPTAMQGGHPRWPDGDLILIGHRATHPTYGPATVDGVFDDGDACVHLDTPVSGGPYGQVDGVDFSTRTFDGWVRLAAAPFGPTGEERNT